MPLNVDFKICDNISAIFFNENILTKYAILCLINSHILNKIDAIRSIYTHPHIIN